MCGSKRRFVQRINGSETRGQKDPGDAKVATLFSDASLPEGARLVRASSMWSVPGCRSACVRLVVLGS